MDKKLRTTTIEKQSEIDYVVIWCDGSQSHYTNLSNCLEKIKGDFENA